MIYAQGHGPDLDSGVTPVIDAETGYDLAQPLGYQQPFWDTVEERALLARLLKRREQLGLPDIDDHIVKVQVDVNTPETVGERVEPYVPTSTHKTAKKPARLQRRQVKPARDRAATLHGDLETS